MMMTMMNLTRTLKMMMCLSSSTLFPRFVNKALQPENLTCCLRTAIRNSLHFGFIVSSHFKQDKDIWGFYFQKYQR